MADKPILEQKCPSCGAPMHFDPSVNKLVCDYCGTTMDIEIEKETVKEEVSRKERDEVLEKIKPLPIYNCVSCGAEVLVSQENGALTCPYCKNNIVLTNQFSGTIKPDGIIPFKITPDKLSAAIYDFYKDKPLLSKAFFSDKRMGNITGVYVPFWVFDCDVKGDVTYTGHKPGSTYRVGDYIITREDHYRLERSISVSFKDLGVDASKKMDDKLMDSIAPFDMRELKPFDIRYLAGYVADRFDQTSKDVQKRNDERVMNTASHAAMAEATRDFYSVSVSANQLKPNMKQAKYVLLPVYVFNVEFNNKKYRYAVNGQTGKVVGELPEDKAVERMYFLKFFALGFLVVAILLFVFFVLGGN